MTQFLEQLCQNLAQRFPNADIMQAFSLLNPKLLPVSAPVDRDVTKFEFEFDNVRTFLADSKFVECFSTFLSNANSWKISFCHIK